MEKPVSSWHRPLLIIMCLLVILSLYLIIGPVFQFAVPIERVWPGFLFLVIPWIVFSIIEWRKYDVYHLHHMMAILYSIFLAFLTLGGLAEYIALRTWGKTQIEIAFNIMDDIAYIVLLIACGYLSYRSAMQATRNIRIATKIVTAIPLALLSIQIFSSAISFTLAGIEVPLWPLGFAGLLSAIVIWLIITTMKELLSKSKS